MSHLSTIAATGHRPDKLGGYSEEVFAKLTSLAEDIIVLARPKTVISGMALGWDQAVAQAAVNKGVPFIAAVPFVGQEKKWPVESQERYRRLLNLALAERVVCTGGYAAEKMQTRNEWMVNQSTSVIALWDGSDGGTKNCVTYAQSQRRMVWNFWRFWEHRR
jgi:uncharacterized phage-like protein YoqJ